MFLTPQMIAREALVRLKGNIAIANEVYRDFKEDFKGKGDKISVRKPATFVADEFGTTINLQEIGEKSVEVKLDTLLDVSVEVSSKEMTLDIQDFGAQVIDGAVLAIAEGINAKVARVAAQGAPNFVGTSGTTPASLKAGFTQPMLKLNLNKVPMAERKLFFDPVAQAELLGLDVVNNADKSGSTNALRMASMGRIMNFDTFMDQAIYTHTAGAYTALADVTITAGAKGANSITLTSGAGTSTAKLVKGDIFQVDGKQYVVTADTAAAVAGVASSVAISPALHAAFGDMTSVDVTFPDVTARGHVANLAFHKNAVVLASRPLEVPFGKNSTNAYTTIDKETGLAVRVVLDYNSTTKKSTISIDALFGVSTVYPELITRVLG